jgi:hypothetical protein
MGIKLHRGFESRPLRHNVEVRTSVKNKGLWGVGSALWSPLCSLRSDGLNLGHDALCQPVLQKHSVGLGQLSASDLDDHVALRFVPFGHDVELLEERLVVAALGLLAAGLVDSGGSLGQLQSNPQVLAIELEGGFRLGQRFMRGSQFVL